MTLISTGNVAHTVPAAAFLYAEVRAGKWLRKTYVFKVFKNLKTSKVQNLVFFSLKKFGHILYRSYLISCFSHDS